MDVRERLTFIIEQDESLNYTNVAKRAGLSSSAVHKFCTGQVRSMTIENLEKIASAINVSYRWLLHGDGEPTDPDNIVSIWDRIDENQKPLALNILKQMTRREKEAG